MKCDAKLNQTLCSIDDKTYDIVSALSSNGTEGALSMAIALSSLNKTYLGEKTPFLNSTFNSYFKG